MKLDELPITLSNNGKRGRGQPDETQVPSKRRRYSSRKQWSWLPTPDFDEPVISCPTPLDETICSHLGELEARNRSVSSLHLLNPPVASDKPTSNGPTERVRRTLSQLKISAKGLKASKWKPQGKPKGKPKRPHIPAQLKMNSIKDSMVTRGSVKKDENNAAMVSSGSSLAPRVSPPIAAIHRIDKIGLRKLREDLLLE